MRDRDGMASISGTGPILVFFIIIIIIISHSSTFDVCMYV